MDLKSQLCLLPDHLCPFNGLLQLHQPLLVLVPLHQDSGHLHPGKAFPLCCGDITLQTESLFVHSKHQGEQTRGRCVTHIVLVLILDFLFGLVELGSNSANQTKSLSARLHTLR